MLATEKLDVVVVLVEVEIEIAAALRDISAVPENTLGSCVTVVLFAARPFLERLHLFPSLVRSMIGLMDIEEDRPVFFRVFNPAFSSCRTWSSS